MGRPAGDARELEKRRVEAIELLRRGVRVAEVARRLGVNRSAVSNWKSWYLQMGRTGIKARRHPTRSLFNISQFQKHVERLLGRGALAFGFASDRWTVGRITKVLRKHAISRVTRSTAFRHLHAWGWRFVRAKDGTGVWVKSAKPRYREAAVLSARDHRESDGRFLSLKRLRMTHTTIPKVCTAVPTRRTQSTDWFEGYVQFLLAQHTTH